MPQDEKPASQKKDKENASPPSSTKKLKDKLSFFASPSCSNNDNEDTNGEKTESITFLHLTYPFLKPENIRDKSKHRPDHPDYDSGTLYVPDSFLEKCTPAQRQWWEFKQDHFDKILFFKMG